MESFLKAKTAGLPRWAWVAILGGALGVGLYLRSRSQTEPEEVEEEPTAGENTLESLEGTESAGGLAAAGLVGPAQGQITPVEAPYIPQGFVDIFESQGQTIQTLAEREPERVEQIREVEPIGEGSPQGLPGTGGGTHSPKPHHKAPKAKPKPKQKAKPKRPPKKRRVAVGPGHPAR